jgi:hypothetical protein
MSAEIQQAMTSDIRDLAEAIDAKVQAGDERTIGHLTAAAHRPWCDPAQCCTDEDAYPLHQSAVLTVPADNGTIGESAVLGAYLQQSPLLPGQPPAPHDTGEVRVYIGDAGLSLDLDAAVRHAEQVLALVAQARTTAGAR